MINRVMEAEVLQPSRPTAPRRVLQQPGATGRATSGNLRSQEEAGAAAAAAQAASEALAEAAKLPMPTQAAPATAAPLAKAAATTHIQPTPVLQAAVATATPVAKTPASTFTPSTPVAQANRQIHLIHQNRAFEGNYTKGNAMDEHHMRVAKDAKAREELDELIGDLRLVRAARKQLRFDLHRVENDTAMEALEPLIQNITASLGSFASHDALNRLKAVRAKIGPKAAARHIAARQQSIGNAASPQGHAEVAVVNATTVSDGRAPLGLVRMAEPGPIHSDAKQELPNIQQKMAKRPNLFAQPSKEEETTIGSADDALAELETALSTFYEKVGQPENAAPATVREAIRPENPSRSTAPSLLASFKAAGVLASLSLLLLFALEL